MLGRVVLLLLLALLAPSEALAVPNVIIIYADDATLGAVNAYGEPLGGVADNTPNIDAIADAGVMFTNAYHLNPVCTPARAMLLTGQMPHQTGVDQNGDTLADTLVTFPDLIGAAGYETWYFGKWQIDPMTGANLGITYRYLCAQAECAPSYSDSTISIDGAASSVVTGYITTVLKDAFLAKAEARTPGVPFVSVIALKGPHAPIVPDLADDGDLDGTEVTIVDPAFDIGRPLRSTHLQNWRASINGLFISWVSAQWQSTFRKSNPPAWVDTTPEENVWVTQEAVKDSQETMRSIDRAVGEITAYLAAEPDGAGFLADNTILCFTSDNGYEFGNHGMQGKLLIYDESSRMPLLCQGPGITPGTVEDGMVSNIDLAPTILDWANISQPTSMRGRSLLELLAGTLPAWRTGVYFSTSGDGDGVTDEANAAKTHYGIITEDWKLIRYPTNAYDSNDVVVGGPEWELIDRQNDPEELANVYYDPANASTIATLQAALQRLRNQYGITRNHFGVTTHGTTVR